MSSDLVLVHFIKGSVSVVNCSITLQSVFFVCFVALRSRSTAMVMGGRSVHLTTLFPGQA